MTGNSTKRARGRPKTFDRARTLEVAIDSYWRDGVDSVSVNEICRRAYAAWLERCANQGEIELPAPIEITATYVDAQLTMMLTPQTAHNPEVAGHVTRMWTPTVEAGRTE